MTKLPTFTKTLFSTIVIIYDGVYEFDVCIDKSSGLLIFKSDIKGLHSFLSLLLILSCYCCCYCHYPLLLQFHIFPIFILLSIGQRFIPYFFKWAVSIIITLRTGLN